MEKRGRKKKEGLKSTREEKKGLGIRTKEYRKGEVKRGSRNVGGKQGGGERKEKKEGRGEGGVGWGQRVGFQSIGGPKPRGRREKWREGESGKMKVKGTVLTKGWGKGKFKEGGNQKKKKSGRYRGRLLENGEDTGTGRGIQTKKGERINYVKDW